MLHMSLRVLFPETSILNFFLHHNVLPLLCPSIKTRLVVIFIVCHVVAIGCYRVATQLITHYTSCNRKLPTICKNCTCTFPSCSSTSANSSNIFRGIFWEIKHHNMIYWSCIKVYTTCCSVRAKDDFVCL